MYVGNLDGAVTPAILKSAFLPFGEIKDVQIPLDMASQQNKGFGFVEFEEEGDAAAAMENMADSELYGRTLRVNEARALRSKAGKAVWAEADQWYASLKESGLIEEGGDAGFSGQSGSAAAASASGSGAAATSTGVKGPERRPS